MTSYPLSKALITLCRDEMSERISPARTVTERKDYLALREKQAQFILKDCHATAGGSQ